MPEIKNRLSLSKSKKNVTFLVANDVVVSFAVMISFGGGRSLFKLAFSSPGPSGSGEENDD